MKILHLTLKKKWFDMIGFYKLEEYREIKPYWITRLLDINMPEEQKGDNKTIPENIIFDLKRHSWEEVLKSYRCEFKKFDAIKFTNGYGKNAPTIVVALEGIFISFGAKPWGAEDGRKYFVLKLGHIITQQQQ